MVDKNLSVATRRSKPESLARSQGDVLDVGPIVLELNALCKGATLQFALAVGGVVTEKLYSGDIHRWRSRERKHDLALRKLATHPDLAMSASMLYGCIAIYELCERLGIRSWKHVSTSHLRLVLSLLPDEQARLLRAAEADRWPVRRLEEEVVALTRGRAPAPGRGGRKRRSRLRGRIQHLQSDLDEVAGLLLPQDPTTEPSPDSTRAAMEVLRRAADMYIALEKRMALAAVVASHANRPSQSAAQEMAPTEDDVP
jgi:hypothetical protein